jgi:hypothetical protein
MSSTPYGISTSIGSSTYNNYVNAPINGPLNTNQYPTAIPYHYKGTLSGVHPNPPQFYSLQEPVSTDQFVNARHQYFRTAVNKNVLAKQIAIGKFSRPTSIFSFSSGVRHPTSTHLNYIEPVDSSLYIQKKRANAVGQSSYKVGLPTNAPYTTKNYYPSGTRSSIRRARSGGCVAPAKKGAIQNTSLCNGKICAWGSIVRATY